MARRSPRLKQSSLYRSLGPFIYRLMGAAMLDASMYEGIEADRSLTRQATAAVLLSKRRSEAARAGSMAAAQGSSCFRFRRAPDLGRLGCPDVPHRHAHPARAADPNDARRTAADDWLCRVSGLLQVFAVFPGMAVPSSFRRRCGCLRRWVRCDTRLITRAMLVLWRCAGLPRASRWWSLSSPACCLDQPYRKQ